MSLISTPLGRKVIGCAIEVHQTLGPGLMESIYQRAFAHELKLNGIPFLQQLPLPVSYKGVDLGMGYRVDFVIGDEIVVELKTVERFLPVHDAQLLTYMRLLNIEQGLIFNFNVGRLADGIRSLVNSRVSFSKEPRQY